MTQPFLPARRRPTLPGKPAPRSLRILTVNCHKGFNWFNRRFILPELRDAVRTLSCDLVFLQEVLGEHERLALFGTGQTRQPQYEFLADSMWPDYAYGRNAVYPEGHHGNALLSKFPILDYRNLDVSVQGNEQRGLLHARLALPAHTPCHAICVHLGLREAHRQSQVDLLCALLDSIPADAPLIVAGDFNDWRLRAHATLARCGLHEVFISTTGNPARSYPARWPLLPLDRIYVRNLGIHAPQVLIRQPWSHLSDHAPLVTEVVL